MLRVLICSHTFDRRGDPRVADGEESAGRGPRGEPVPRRESLDQRHKVRLQVRCAVLLGHVTQALYRLIAHDGLLDGGEGLEWRQETVHMLRTANQRRERSKLLRQGQQYLKIIKR